MPTTYGIHPHPIHLGSRLHRRSVAPASRTARLTCKGFRNLLEEAWAYPTDLLSNGNCKERV